MAAHKRLAKKDTEIRSKLIETARGIVDEEGCGALTIGRLAKSVGLTRTSVHYHFGTLEDIFVEILDLQSNEVERRTREAFDGRNPLRVIWEFRRATSALTSELMAMAQRSPRIRERVATSMETLNRISIEALEVYAAQPGVVLPAPPPVIATILRSISFTVAVGRDMDITVGHEETIQYIEQWISKLEEADR